MPEPLFMDLCAPWGPGALDTIRGMEDLEVVGPLQGPDGR